MVVVGEVEGARDEDDDRFGGRRGHGVCWELELELMLGRLGQMMLGRGWGVGITLHTSVLLRQEFRGFGLGLARPNVRCWMWELGFDSRLGNSGASQQKRSLPRQRIFTPPEPNLQVLFCQRQSHSSAPNFKPEMYQTCKLPLLRSRPDLSEN